MEWIKGIIIAVIFLVVMTLIDFLSKKICSQKNIGKDKVKQILYGERVLYTIVIVGFVIYVINQ